MAQVATMRCMNISFGKIKYLMAMFYGVDISKATLNHFCDVVGNAFEPLYEDLKTGMHVMATRPCTGMRPDGM